MRTLVDIPQPDLDALDEVAKARAQSRAALIRQAVGDFLAKHQSTDLTTAFGLWSTAEDGLAYQNRLRGEW